MSMETVEKLASLLQGAASLSKKKQILDAEPPVRELIKSSHPLSRVLAELPPAEEIAIKQLIAIGQAPLNEKALAGQVQELAAQLATVDDFYRELGGLAGYQKEVLRHLSAGPARLEVQYHSPFFIDITQETED